MAVKKSTKHSKKATSKKSSTSTKKAKIVYEEPKRKKDYFFPVLLLIVAVIIVGFVSNGTFFFDKLQAQEAVVVEGNQTVLVNVNGEEITQAEIDEYWDRLPPQLKVELSKEDLLEEFIQERLLLQEADDLGISVSDEEVDEYITAQLSASGLTYDQFEQLVQQQGTTVERMRDIYARQLTLAKLFEQQSDDNLNATRAEIEAYYEANIDNFFVNEQVTVRHILIPINDNLNETEAQARVVEVEALLDEQNNENFCELVEEYSGDPGSIANCGEYTFGRGVMVSQFEEAGFDMDVEERRTVETRFGFHIMLKDEDIPARYLRVDEEIDEEGTTVAIVIERILAEEKAREVYEAYIAELREEADIFYESAAQPNEEVAESEVSEDSNTAEETVEEPLDDMDEEAVEETNEENSEDSGNVIVEVE